MTSITDLAEGYATIVLAGEQTESCAKWRWAKMLSELMDSLADPKTRTNTSITIGAEIGAQLQTKPLSGSWVRQHAAAFSKFPTEPANQAEYRQFLMACNGNAGKSKTEKPEEIVQLDSEGNLEGGTGTSSDLLVKLTKLVQRIVKDGAYTRVMIDAAYKAGF